MASSHIYVTYMHVNSKRCIVLTNALRMRSESLSHASLVVPADRDSACFHIMVKIFVCVFESNLLVTNEDFTYTGKNNQ